MPQDLLLEIGTEELPASFVLPALDEMKQLWAQKAQDARLSHGDIAVYGTPRRLALLVKDVSDSQPDLVCEILGPPVRVAFDAQGKPTPVAQKWAAAQGVDPEKLDQKDTPKGRYVFLERKEKGQPALQILPDLLKSLVAGIHFKKSMRWGWEDLTFARPVQWILALHGKQPVKFQFADVQSGAVTYGHRFMTPGAITIGEPAQYLTALTAAKVIADPNERQALVKQAAADAAATVGGKVLDDPALLHTVSFLVEQPDAVLGSFDKEFLDLPPMVLISEAKGHQKYFSVVNDKGELMPHFVAISNTTVKDKSVSRVGYERMLRSRLSDARFFFTEDKKRPLADRVENLKRVVFQQKLGTSYEKMERFRALATWLAQELQLTQPAFTKAVDRAAYLCKADLVTGMVGEFPELQGVMGREYAKGAESDEVATAIYEHYLPRFADDVLPSQDAGALVGMADRLDTIVGIIGIGRAPTGAADPYGLRRACLAMINIALGRGYAFSLAKAVDRALDLLGPKVANKAQTRDQVLEFFRERLKNLWAENARRDVVEAVLSAGFENMVEAQQRLSAMNAIVGRADFEPLAIAFKRVVNIVEKQAKDVQVKQVNVALLSEEGERALHQAFESARGRIEAATKAHDFTDALNQIAQLKPAVDRFFDTVRVLADDQQLKENRVALLTGIGRLFAGIADFSKIQAGEQPGPKATVMAAG